MSKASILIGRFQPPTPGHLAAIKAAQDHAKETGGKHYIFPTHTTGTATDPLDHDTKVKALRALFPDANVVSNTDVKTPIQMIQHLEKLGHTNVTILGGGEEDQNKWKFLDKYKKKEYPKIKKISVASAGERDEKATDVTGMSGTKLRNKVKEGDKKGFINAYPEEHKELATSLYNKLSTAMTEKKKKLKESVAIFLIGGPGSGKDFVLKNTFAKFDLMEVQIDHVLNGNANKLFEENKNIVINGPIDADKINEVQSLHENYQFDYIYVSVTNKVSRLRNEQREHPHEESKRIEKFLNVENLIESLEDVFVFNNSMNINAASAFEHLIFEDQTSKLEQRLDELEIPRAETPELKTFNIITEKFKRRVAKDKESGLPKKYVAGLSSATAKARAAHWKEKDKLSDSDPSKHTLAIRKMMDEGITGTTPIQRKVPRIARLRKPKLVSENNLKQLIDTTKLVTNMLSIPPNKLNIISENKAVYSENNVIWEAVKHPSSQRWYLTGNYNENNDG
jgi:dephospho-CoA kinase